MNRSKHDNRLVCGVRELTYDFRTRVGRLHLPDLECCDMAGCLEIFTHIDPDVTRIETFSGRRPDTVYQRVDGTWTAYWPRSVAWTK